MSKQELEKKMSALAGVPVEITIVDERRFTFSVDEINPTAAEKIADYFRSQPGATVEAWTDEECEMSGVYLTIAA